MDVESRLAKLERENRVMKWAAIVIAGLVGSMALMGQAATPKVVDEIRTKRLVVVDAAGKARAGLGLVQGAPWLSLYDAGGKTRAALGLTEQGYRPDSCRNTR